MLFTGYASKKLPPSSKNIAVFEKWGLSIYFGFFPFSTSLEFSAQCRFWLLEQDQNQLLHLLELLVNWNIIKPLHNNEWQKLRIFKLN